jgi:carbonic anhydrase
MDKLIAGYRRFRKERWPAEQALFRSLADSQKPHALVIGCCDSRVDPATIFSAGPGELFVVRIVSSIVPPYEVGGGYHGTSASIAFGILELKIGIILVLGHARCGGVTAALAASPKKERIPFVSDWVDLLAPAVARAPAEGDRQTLVEQEGVKLSMERLLTFPFIAEAVATGRLQIRGAHFGVANGELSVLNEATGNFETVAP